MLVLPTLALYVNICVSLMCIDSIFAVSAEAVATAGLVLGGLATLLGWPGKSACICCTLGAIWWLFWVCCLVFLCSVFLVYGHSGSLLAFVPWVTLFFTSHSDLSEAACVSSVAWHKSHASTVGCTCTSWTWCDGGYRLSIKCHRLSVTCLGVLFCLFAWCGLALWDLHTYCPVLPEKTSWCVLCSSLLDLKFGIITNSPVLVSVCLSFWFVLAKKNLWKL